MPSVGHPGISTTLTDVTQLRGAVTRRRRQMRRRRSQGAVLSGPYASPHIPHVRHFAAVPKTLRIPGVPACRKGDCPACQTRVIHDRRRSKIFRDAVRLEREVQRMNEELIEKVGENACLHPLPEQGVAARLDRVPDDLGSPLQQRLNLLQILVGCDADH